MIELSVYATLDTRSKNIPLYRVRPLVPDVFDYNKTVDFCYMVYGPDCVIEILNVKFLK